jgi:antitoxin CcdA
MRICCALEADMGNTARKQPTNLSIRSDLLRQARAREINLSKTLEESLEKILRAQDRQAWVEDNREAIEAANRFVAEHGLWSDGLRKF